MRSAYVRLATMKKVFAASLFFCIPLFANPQLFLARGNDFEIFFWPLFYFVKTQLQSGIFPLWYPHILSGTPLVTDPQAPLFYIPNILFLFTSIDAGFILSFFLHIFLGGAGIYFIAKRIIKYSGLTAFTASFVYLANPKVATYLEAGHVGLIFAWGWIPWTFVATWNLIHNFQKRWLMLFVISFYALFVLHTITFAVVATGNTIILLYFLIAKKIPKGTILKFLFAGILTLGIVSVALLPQLSWSPITNRVFLTEKPDVYPKWLTKKEFVEVTITPWIRGIDQLKTFDTEKYYPIGITLGLLAILGFTKVNRKLKLLIIITGIPLVLIVLNNISPIHTILINQQWFQLMRVSTRVWIIFILVALGVATFGLENIKPKFKKILAAIVIVETLFLSWAYMAQKPNPNTFVTETTLSKITQDTSQFRVFCLTHCISQKDAARYNLELITGYSTLIQQNYSKVAWGFSGNFWDYYTLAIPPYSITENVEQRPDFESLGYYNTKYILSPYQLYSDDLTYREKTEGYFLYTNNWFQPRAYYINEFQVPLGHAETQSHTVNKTIINTEKKLSNKIIISSVYSPGWNAYDQSESLKLTESPNGLQLITLNENSKEIFVEYNPTSYTVGKIISLFTVIIVAFYFVTRRKIVTKQ